MRKLIHVRSGNAGPLPGSTPEDYFVGWLKFGTCWSGAGALHAFLLSLGFANRRAVGTMLAAPNLPPNHGSALVTFDRERYLVDSSILHGEPQRLEEDSETSVNQGAWGVRCSRRDERWHVRWRPLNRLEGFECRYDEFGASAEVFRKFYDQTRGWSPFNYEVTARVNRGENVVGVAVGHAVTLCSDGRVRRTPVSLAERCRVLIEEVGISAEIVRLLPEDVPTPPPPWSRTAQLLGEPPVGQPQRDEECAIDR